MRLTVSIFHGLTVAQFLTASVGDFLSKGVSSTSVKLCADHKARSTFQQR